MTRTLYPRVGGFPRFERGLGGEGWVQRVPKKDRADGGALHVSAGQR
jgi:hypothetical protein